MVTLRNVLGASSLGSGGGERQGKVMQEVLESQKFPVGFKS